MAGVFVTRYENIPGLTANADLSTHQFKAVKMLSTAGSCALAATSVAVTVWGLLQNNPKSGDAADFAFSGIAKGIAGTSLVVVGSALGVNTTSRLVVTTSDNAWLMGRSLSKASAIGDIISVLLTPGTPRY